MRQAPDGITRGSRSRQGIEDLVDDNGIQFVGELARGAIAFVVGNFPPEVELALRICPLDSNSDTPALRERVDGEARQHGLGPQNTEWCACGLLGYALDG